MPPYGVFSPVEDLGELACLFGYLVWEEPGLACWVVLACWLVCWKELEY